MCIMFPLPHGNKYLKYAEAMGIYMPTGTSLDIFQDLICIKIHANTNELLTTAQTAENRILDIELWAVENPCYTKVTQH